MQKNFQEHVHSIAEFFFFFIGICYAIGYLFSENGLFVVLYEYFLALADIPFLFSALLYFFLSMRLKSENIFLKNRLDERETKDFFWQESIFLFLGILIFSIYFLVDIFR